MKLLGVIFILVAIVLGFFAARDLPPTDLERLSDDAANAARSARETKEALNGFAAAEGLRAIEIDDRKEKEWRNVASDRRSARERKQATQQTTYGILAGILATIGLVITVAGGNTQATSSAVDAHGETAGKLNSINPLENNRAGRLFVFLRGEVKGPFNTGEIEALLKCGTISLETQCCVEGAQEWQPISSFAT